MDEKPNEETITPYIIVNKTDMPFLVRRLFVKERNIEAKENYSRYKELMSQGNKVEANLWKRKYLTH